MNLKEIKATKVNRALDGYFGNNRVNAMNIPRKEKHDTKRVKRIMTNSKYGHFEIKSDYLCTNFRINTKNKMDISKKLKNMKLFNGSNGFEIKNDFMDLFYNMFYKDKCDDNYFMHDKTCTIQTCNECDYNHNRKDNTIIAKELEDIFYKDIGKIIADYAYEYNIVKNIIPLDMLFRTGIHPTSIDGIPHKYFNFEEGIPLNEQNDYNKTADSCYKILEFEFIDNHGLEEIELSYDEYVLPDRQGNMGFEWNVIQNIYYNRSLTMNNDKEIMWIKIPFSLYNYFFVVKLNKKYNYEKFDILLKIDEDICKFTSVTKFNDKFILSLVNNKDNYLHDLCDGLSTSTRIISIGFMSHGFDLSNAEIIGLKIMSIRSNIMRHLGGYMETLAFM